MTSFEIMGQAKLDAAQAQRELAHMFAAWLGRTFTRLLDATARHLPEGRAMPW